VEALDLAGEEADLLVNRERHFGGGEGDGMGEGWVEEIKICRSDL
jgi:hypothetical protein